ncbi:unnamed protein product [Cylicocyclus nassatus]|uniref:Bridge-like lipid transfer protein family member 1 C-terminal domain-containing protein n=1 Tax=Cylicocyclus nassatus TaxID=53992 RepID=A0AA36M9M0_CYLNA|nr:unnamed protein product [Cylicocyclus nassatus]
MMAMNDSDGDNDLFDNIKINIKLDDGTIDPDKRSFWVLLSSLVLFVAWIIFLTYYLSRIIGPIVSFILNRYLRFTKTPGHIKLGSFSLSLLGGKLMFKDFLFANDDYSIRINDAWIIFSYWRYVPGRKVCFKSNASRLHVSLNGLQIHVYNRVQRYKEIAKLFRMEKVFGDDPEVKRQLPVDSAAPSAYWDRIWSLVGVIKLDIWSGRVVIGNRLLPYMLVVSLENMNSKVRLYESVADRALLSVEGQAESVRADFLKHPDYTGTPYKDPPRTMGDGFALLQSALLHFFYHQDILGYVTVDEQSLVNQRPVWESILRFDHNTVLSYGPWVESQRALLYSFFFPSDYQTAAVDELPKRGKRRIYIMHDVRISLLKETAVDIWFMRGDQLESVHSRCQPGSTIDMSIWWITKEDGFSWSVHTSLLRLESTSSLPYRKLLEAETFSVDAEFHYPRVFNAKQTWDFKFRLSKCCCWLVWDHQRFVTDLLNEFLGDTTSDLVTFVPYTVAIDFDVTDSFEGILLLNESNWVDPTEKNPENVEAAIVGSHFNLSFTLPFEDFMPELITTKYSLRLENGLALRMRYPPGSAIASVVAALFRGAHVNLYSTPAPHGKHSRDNEDWHEVWRTESVTSIIEFTYHPLVPKFKSDIPFHVLQEFLPKPVEHPKDLSPDKMDVKLEIGGSEVQFTGALIKCVIELKNNYFGLYDSMTDVTQPGDPAANRSIYSRVAPNAPVEKYRPMEVTFDMRVFNIRAHCLTYGPCSEEKELCPVLYTEEIAVLIKKGFSETLIQIGVGPCAAYFERVSAIQSDGYMTLSGLQFRGHAMFSSEDCPWDMAVVEYGWLMEILVGEVGGCLGTPSQIISLVNFLDTLLLLVIAKDEEKVVPERFKFCQHGQTAATCTKGSQPGRPCETEERLKYRQMRVSVDGVRLALADENSALTVAVDPLRFTLCNAHEKRFTEHICLRIPNIVARQLFHPSESPTWIECARASISGTSLDVELPFPYDSSHLEVLRQSFLLKHDRATRRLQFLWDRTSVWGCACYGGTAFMAKEDKLGQFFLTHLDRQLCVHSMNADTNGQPGVFQDILHPERKLFREELHQYFTASRKTSSQSRNTGAGSEIPSVETASFHSAMSNTLPMPAEKCLLSMRPLIEAYAEYLNQFEVAKAKSEAPQFGAPGDIAQWVESRTFDIFEAQEGVAEVHLRVEDLGKGSSRTQSELSCEVFGGQQNNDLPAKSSHRSFAINGCVASVMEVFFTPLAFEVMDRFIKDISRCASSLHPAMLAQICYRECVGKEHRQPLTESLFTSSETGAALGVSVDLPRVHISMFECSLISGSGSGEVRTAANLGLVLLKKASISSGTIKEFADKGTSFHAHSSVLSAQLLHFTPILVSDFAGNRVNFNATVNWGKTALASRLLDVEPRVVVDFQIPDLEVMVERREAQQSDSVAASDKAASLPLVKTLYLHKAKVEVGSVSTLVVMARPLEMTGKNEFPLYDVLSPCLTTWLHTSEKLADSISDFSLNWSATIDMTFAQVLKMALDCTDDRIFTAAISKSVMLKVKELGPNLAGCPSCLLLHTLLRWCALPSSAEKLSTSSLTPGTHPQFSEKANRKTALMALLSHWHTDICQQVKLASNVEARKYRADPGSVAREVRIPMDDLEKPEMKHRRNASTGSRNLTGNGTTSQQRPSAQEKVDLYHWLLSVHRERKDRKTGDLASKDYINPMDIVPQAFFYSFYHSRRLDWTQLDGLPLNQLALSYTITINDVVVAMVEHRVVSSAADASRKFITPHLHQLMHIKKVFMDGKMSWRIDMDEKGLLPVRGWCDLTYSGNVENVRFVVALCSVCLIKEIMLVVKNCIDIPVDSKRRPSVSPSAARSPVSVQSNATAKTHASLSWDERVLDMMRDFEKNRSRSTKKKRGDVLTKIVGNVAIDSIRLESILTDLYVSLMVQLIEVTQQHNPSYERSTKILSANQTLQKLPADVIDMKLRKASLALMESENAKQNTHIVNCTLHESTSKLTRRSGDANSEEPLTTLHIMLGSIEGELPMAAHSLHDVVMRHGPQLEQQFNRLSAQPLAISNSVLISDVNLAELPMVEPGAPAPWFGKAEPAKARPRAPVAKVKFNFETSSIELRARLLPSLLARYKLNRASSSGVTGDAAKWTAGIDSHQAEFCVSSAGKPMDTFTLALPAIAVNGEYTVDKGDAAPTTSKTLLYREGGYLKMSVTLGQVNHSFTTDLLNQILFAEQSFRSELSALVSRLKAERSGWSPTAAQSVPAEKQPTLLFFLTVKGQGVPWLQLTAATPTATAVRFTVESLDAELTNRWVVKEHGSAKERLFGAAAVQFNAKLGQLVKVAQYEELQPELQEYATFMTQVRVENKESSSHQSYSYHIALNRPILLVKSSAIDKAILLWLNYKNTYDYWRDERSRVVRAAKTRTNSFQHAMFSPPQASQVRNDFDVNLTLAINNGMYVCMPLYSQDLTDGMPALVLSLQKSDVTVCIMKELACQASFHGFKLNFIDNFDELSLSESIMEATGETQTNYFFFPQGTYQLCSQASADAAGAKWVLSVRAQMRGMVIDLDQRIGKLAKMVVNTFSSLGDNEEEFDDKASHISEDEDHLVEGGSELKTLRPEERVPWMERKMHEQSTLVSDLVACKASEKRIEAERKKLRQYELIRFKEFRRSMIEKIRRRKNTAKQGERTRRGSKLSEAFDSLPRAAKITPEGRVADSDDKGPTENVKMAIDVQVSIESGRCTLRTAPKQEQSAMVPLMVKKPSSKDLRAKTFSSSQLVNLTRFSMPSLDMKGYYVSGDSLIPSSITTALADHQLKQSASMVDATAHPSTSTANVSLQRKRGCFYLSAALASMPTETVVTPHLADYLEQVLDPLPISSGATVTSVPSAEPQEGVAHIVGMDTSALPIDVLFFLTVQSSTIRFDGQQQRSSAADCLLKLPCLSLMASTRRTVEDAYVGGIDVSATLSAFSLSIYSPHQQSTAHDALSLTLDHLSFVISRSKNSSIEADNRVKFVLTSNIGAANFNYDMRRLSELIAFPKPWYRAAIARRVFFGDQAMSREPASQPSTIASRNLIVSSSGPTTVRNDKAWSATVLLAVQWKELNVNAQMSNTMGNTSWKARRGLLRAIAKLNSRSERNVTLTFKLDSSELTAHGGAISGEIALSRLLLSASHARLANQPPRNGAKVQLRWLAARIEWMSRAILIGRCEKPAISLGDEFSREKNEHGEYIRACVRLNVRGSWEDLQVVITRNTVDDIQKIVNKLKTFFEEQLKSSKMVWGIQQDSSSASAPQSKDEAVPPVACATQYWQKVLDSVTEIQFKEKILPIPQHGETVVGGFVGLEAGKVSLACMHGEMNAHSWALFHLRYPGIVFTPEAKFSYIDREQDVIGVAVRQKLVIRLGLQGRRASDNVADVPKFTTENMATVCRVQQNRNSIMRQNASISTSLDYLIGDALKQIGLAPVAADAPAPSTRGQHSVLELFQFPALEAVLVSDQINECDVEELDEDERPEVHSTLVCDFLDAVCVQTDFNAQVSFLPELLKSYIQVSDSPLPVEKPSLKTDRRRYLCEKWAVDPKIRFIDRFRWNPPVIDEILRKLQIFDHRTTIPKALQRAVLDPLDQGLATALYELLRLVDRTKPPHERSAKV